MGLRKYFLTGILAILPLGITAWILYKVFVTIDSTVTPWISRYTGVEVPGTGFAATIVFVFFVGLFASNIIGRAVIHRFEAFFAKVPLFSKVYIAVKQIGEAIIGSQKKLFQRVVMFEYPRRGSWAIGFVTSEHRGLLAQRTGKKIMHVFVPTTPNPTSGFLLFLPAEDLIELDMTVEDGLKLVISGGAVTPASQRGGPAALPGKS
jgi:uncharacterized membrane protein